MQRCAELSHLSKSNGLKSVQFKRTTPGCIHQFSYGNKVPPKHRILDPFHPALDYTTAQFARAFPWRTYPGFAIRAIPKGLLEKPPTPFPDPPFTTAPIRSPKAQDGRQVKGRVSMSLMNVAAKSIGGRVLRVNVLNKLKTVISLVAARGAVVENGQDGQPRIVFSEEPKADDWILSDWTYLCRPSLEISRMPFPALVSSLRHALKDIVLRGHALERQWSGRSIRQKAPQVHAQKEIGRAQRPAVYPIKQGAIVEQLLDTIASSPTDVVQSSSQASPSLSQPAVSSSSLVSVRLPAMPRASPALDAMIQRMRSRLTTSSNGQKQPVTHQERVQAVTTNTSRGRGNVRTSTKGPTIQVRS